MICIRCKKRPAVVFLQREGDPTHKSEGYCLTCAQELGIKPVDDLMKQFGIKSEDLAALEERFAGYLENASAQHEAAQSDDGAVEGEGENEQAATTGAGFPFGMGGREGMPFFPFGQGAKAEREEGGGKEEKDAKGKAKPKRRFLEAFGINLNQKAQEGKMDRIIGREKEIARTLQILVRRQKNNPVLIGEAGVGKTAIAEGIAQRIVEGKVPPQLKHKELYLLDMAALVAGTQFRGQFESRIKGLIGEVKQNGNIILFIDEVHNLTGAGESEGAMSAANILKPALSRGELQVIGATTFSEYRKYIEKDQALERRFQPVRVEEPSIEDTKAMLRGVKEYYEKHHQVQVPDAVVDLAVVMSERYITDRFLPDKAIDLLDEACAACNLRHAEIADLSNLKDQIADLLVREGELEQKTDMQSADFEELANLRTQLIALQEKLPDAEAKVAAIEVERADVAKVVELWTGIPAAKIEETQAEKLAGLEERLKEKVIGQDEACHLVATAIKRSRAGITTHRRPASFIFVGPTGVGKTELVKQLANQLFSTPEPLIRLDMSEFMEKFAVSRLVGSPPGYVGYDEAGQLTEKVRRRPYSVVLFDEIEKAHPDVMNILLQILDEGKINDAQGRTVNFENTVVVMTSNAGSSDKTAILGYSKSQSEASKEKSLKALSDFLRPEFLARVDEIVTFNPLTAEDLVRIAALQLDELAGPLSEKGIRLLWTARALDLLVEKAAGGKFGARDLRRVIRKEVEDKLAEWVLARKSIQTLFVDARDGEVVVEDHLTGAALAVDSPAPARI